jgi:hypothetical protein
VEKRRQSDRQSIFELPPATSAVLPAPAKAKTSVTLACPTVMLARQFLEISCQKWRMTVPSGVTRPASRRRDRKNPEIVSRLARSILIVDDTPQTVNSCSMSSSRRVTEPSRPSTAWQRSDKPDNFGSFGSSLLLNANRSAPCLAPILKHPEFHLEWLHCYCGAIWCACRCRSIPINRNTAEPANPTHVTPGRQPDPRPNYPRLD